MKNHQINQATTSNTPSAVTPFLVHQPVSSLIHNPGNPRVHSKKQIRQIAKSIKTFGFIVPAIVDENNRIIAGHGRVLAAQELGLIEIPTIRVDHLTEAQIKAFAIADNRLTENSIWDDQLLAKQLTELSELNLDFSIDVTGFEMGEIDLRIEGLTESLSENGPDAADAPPAASKPVTQAGDIWILGDHRIACGNSLEAATFTHLMGEEKAKMIFTDPPYNVPIDGHVGGNGSITHRDFAMATGEMTETEFTSFLTTSLGYAAAHSFDGAIHFVCMDWRHIPELFAAGRVVYTELKNMCVWSKDVAGMGTFYRSAHELVFVYKNGTASHQNNFQLGQNGRYRTNIWKYPSVGSFARETEEGSLLKLHPTVKPVRLVSDAILDCSSRGDLILDPFLGSGTTLLAAQRVGRRCYGIEFDPLYVDCAIRRWQTLTGENAVHQTEGKSFYEKEAPHA